MDNRVGFIQWILGEEDGFVALGHKHARTGDWRDQIFQYPGDLDGIAQYVTERYLMGDMYFCPTVLAQPRRIKDNVRTSLVIWSDLDECHPDELLLKPTVTIESSRGRYQAFWRLKAPAHALDVEQINKRIAYHHASQGADKSGWDLTQYLRIPGTKNHKRQPVLEDVKIIDADTERLYELSDFDVYPAVDGIENVEIPFPEPNDLPDLTAAEFLESIKTSVHPRVWQLFANPPEKDWSKDLWQLELMLFDVGCSREEVFLVVRDAACNKYRRDGLDDTLLWKEVCRAKEEADNRAIAISGLGGDGPAPHVPNVKLLTEGERQRIELYRTVVDDYVDWAKTVGDAAPQYHIAGAFVLLSCMTSSSVRLPTSFGVLVPNLWFMILADTTLTRKTTAMDLAMDMAVEIDPDIMLATDGSLEGLMNTIASRPRKASVFLRDEFSGLIDAMGKKDYLAGMLETLTKLYDGKFQKRVLKKEVIQVRDPILIMFAGGIRNRIFELLNYNHINSGFIPRFCFITAESDINRVKPLGPPNRQTLDGRERLLTRFRDLYTHYQPLDMTNTEQVIPQTWEATLTDEAWMRYNKLDHDMLQIGIDSSMPDLMTPMMARLATSGLKAAVLIAASQRPGQPVVVEEIDLLKAFSYVEDWKQHAIAVVMNAGQTPHEKLMERVYNHIVESGDSGSLRSELMQIYRLNARDANNIFDTLEQRGLIRVSKERGTMYYATHTTTIKAGKS